MFCWFGTRSSWIMFLQILKQRNWPRGVTLCYENMTCIVCALKKTNPIFSTPQSSLFREIIAFCHFRFRGPRKAPASISGRAMGGVWRSMTKYDEGMTKLRRRYDEGMTSILQAHRRIFWTFVSSLSASAHCCCSIVQSWTRDKQKFYDDMTKVWKPEGRTNCSELFVIGRQWYGETMLHVSFGRRITIVFAMVWRRYDEGMTKVRRRHDQVFATNSKCLSHS